MLRIAATLLPLPLLLATAVPAQELPQPAKQLEKFAPLLGHWTGSGTAHEGPGAPAGPWTATVHSRKVLGGHFIRDDTEIDVGMATPLQMRGYYGWDAQNERYVSCGVDNMGGVALTEIHWAGDAMISVNATQENGQPVVDRWVTVLGKDSYTIECQRAVGGGSFFTHVTGTFKRAGGGVAPAKTVEAAFAMAEPAKPLASWKPMFGTYEMKGWYAMAPGSKMDISAVETMRPIFGGTAIEQVIKGQPFDYEAVGLIGWNAEKKCFTHLCLNSMGEVGSADGRWIDDKLVFTFSGMMMGQPTVNRSIIHVDADGAIREVEAHGISAAQPPAQQFHGTYTKR